MPEIYKYAIIVCSTFFAAFGNYYFKLATASVHNLADGLKSRHVYIGSGVYVVSSLLYIWSHYLLTIYNIVAMASLTYVWTMIIAKVKLHEKIGMMKLIGFCLVIAGSILSVYAK